MSTFDAEIEQIRGELNSYESIISHRLLVSLKGNVESLQRQPWRWLESILIDLGGPSGPLVFE
jgi:hypothetical protein